jgi:hypothetical protein
MKKILMSLLIVLVLVIVNYYICLRYYEQVRAAEAREQMRAEMAARPGDQLK